MLRSALKVHPLVKNRRTPMGTLQSGYTQTPGWLARSFSKVLMGTAP